MKKLLKIAAIGLLTTAILDPFVYSMLEKPIPWGKDLIMGIAGAACFYALIRFRDYL